jgi:hypothetical protein
MTAIARGLVLPGSKLELYASIFPEANRVANLSATRLRVPL